MKPSVVVLGAGFGGLELTATLSEAMGDGIDITLIDRNESFFFGFSKLDVMFGHKEPDAVRIAYKHIVKPGVRFRQETVTAIDPEARRVTTDGGAYEADYDIDATPGLADGANEFYSFEGALKLREAIPNFTSGHAVVGVAGAPFKCPPAPSEAALMLHDYLVERGVREACDITLVMPFGVPVPPSPETSKALLAAFKERAIEFVPQHTIKALDSQRRVVVLDDDSELECDLFLGIPKHKVPDVVERSGLTEYGWIPVEAETLKTLHAGVYAVGDVTSVGTPKAGVFAEGAAGIVAAEILADIQGREDAPAYDGRGSCYIQFGADRVGRVDVDFFSGPTPTGTFTVPSEKTYREKVEFGSSRRSRWFGL